MSKVYLVGAGPGDPDLITLKGLKILKQAEVIIYDYLIDKKILEYADTEAELICADQVDKRKFKDGFTPHPPARGGMKTEMRGATGVNPRGSTKRQDLVNELLVRKVKEKKKVVRLKNGDPFVFGRATEEMEALRRNRIEFVVVPGVTAVTAAACFSGIPLTSRGISASVVITTGHENPDKKDGFVDWDKIAQIDTIVLYMAVGVLSQTAQKLIVAGKRPGTPVTVISNVSKIGQKQVQGTLKDISSRVRLENISAPAVVIIGEVAEKEINFNWFRKIKKVLFTGISPERYFEKALIYHLPMIEIKPLSKYPGMDALINRIEEFDWLIFSSRYGVFYFFERLFKLGKDSRDLNNKKFAAIGSSTAKKLKKYGISADVIPEKESSSGLIAEFRKIKIKGKKILLPRSDIADKGLTEAFKNLGAKVFPCVAYRNVMPKNLPDVDLSFFDEIIFTSPSTVRNFIKKYGKPPADIGIQTIGQVTKNEVKKWGLPV